MTAGIAESLVKQGLFVINTVIDSTFINVPPGDYATSHVNNQPGNQWLRWNLVWFLFFCVLFIPVPFWLFWLDCAGGFYAAQFVNLWTILVLAVCMILASSTMIRMFRLKHVKWLEQDPFLEQVAHMVVMTGYKEPLDLIMHSIDSLQNQTIARRLFVVIGFEERTPDFENKKNLLLSRYKDVFLHIMVTQHPYGLPGEMPGKCSNANYATRRAAFELWRLGLGQRENCTFTICDTDNLFPPKYFEYLAYDFHRTEKREEVVWQAPLFYNLHLDQRPFFVRVTGIQRSVFMMGITIPQSINTMSIYSMSLALIEKGFFHQSYQMEDIINVVRRMIRIHKLVKIRLIPYGVVSGPTSGDTYVQEIVEWARQARRWTIGAAEVFHYICIKWKSFGLLSGMHYAIIFTHYYGFVICGMSLFSLSSLIASFICSSVGVCTVDDYPEFIPTDVLTYLPTAGLAFSYIFYLWAFVIDAFATRLLDINEDIGIIRNFLHFISAPFVLLGYSVIEFFAIVEVAIYGRSVCNHGASKKEGLKQKF